jgi:hypothetical protein
MHQIYTDSHSSSHDAPPTSLSSTPDDAYILKHLALTSNPTPTLTPSKNFAIDLKAQMIAQLNYLKTKSQSPLNPSQPTPKPGHSPTNSKSTVKRFSLLKTQKTLGKSEKIFIGKREYDSGCNSGDNRSFVSGLSGKVMGGVGEGEGEGGGGGGGDGGSDFGEFSFGIDEEDLVGGEGFEGDWGVGREEGGGRDEEEMERKRLNESIFVEFRDYQMKKKAGEVRTRNTSDASSVSCPGNTNGKKIGGKLCFGSKYGDSAQDARKSVESRLDNSSCDLEKSLYEDQ